MVTHARTGEFPWAGQSSQKKREKKAITETGDIIEMIDDGRFITKIEIVLYTPNCRERSLTHKMSAQSVDFKWKL